MTTIHTVRPLLDSKKKPRLALGGPLLALMEKRLVGGRLLVAPKIKNFPVHGLLVLPRRENIVSEEMWLALGKGVVVWWLFSVQQERIVVGEVPLVVKM